MNIFHNYSLLRVKFVVAALVAETAAVHIDHKNIKTAIPVNSFPQPFLLISVTYSSRFIYSKYLFKYSYAFVLLYSKFTFQ